MATKYQDYLAANVLNESKIVRMEGTVKVCESH